MSLTKVDCEMLQDDCVDALRNSFTLTFDTDAYRDAFFSANKNLLENADGKNTLVFVGTTSLKYAFWNGPDNPTTYDKNNWAELPVAATQQIADIHYWGDPNTDLSMRARRDPATGFLIFERRQAGVWTQKMTISNSITLDDVLFTEAKTMPTVLPKELGLYAAYVKDSERGNLEMLRPVFMDSDHNHYMAVAALPDGTLRVPNNVDAALADPENVPLTYNHALLDNSPLKIIQTLNTYTGGVKIKASLIDGTQLMTGAQIVNAITTGGAKIPAASIDGLPTIDPQLVTDVADNKQGVATNTGEIATLKQQVAAIPADVKITSMVANVDRTATINLSDGSSFKFDATPWFGATPTAHDIWYAFVQNSPPDEAAMKAGASASVTTIDNHRVDVTRAFGGTPAYIAVWVPKVLGEMSYVDAGGLHDTWAHTDLVIDGVDGRVYVSDNQTHAQDYTFRMGTNNVY